MTTVARGNQYVQHIVVDEEHPLDDPTPEQLQAWQTTLAKLHARVTNPTKPLVDVDTAVDALIYKFHACNFVVPNAGLAITDLLFVLICYHSVASRKPGHIPDTSPKDIFPVLQEVRALACQHTGESFQLWPSLAYQEDLWNRVADVVVSQLWEGETPADRDKLADRLTRLTTTRQIQDDALVYVNVHTPVPKVIEDRINSMKYKGRKKDGSPEDEWIVSTNIYGEETKTRRVDTEQQKGDIWTESIDRFLGQFIPFCTRVWSKLQLDERTFTKYTMVNEATQRERWSWHRVYMSSYETRLKAWVLSKHGSYGISNRFKDVYKGVTYESCVPMGCRQDSFKNVEDMHSLKAPYSLFGEQLGNHAVGNMHAEVDAIMDEKQRPFLYQFAAITCFAYEMQQRLVSFFGDYYIGDTQLYSKHPSLDVKEVFWRPRRPILVHAKRQWMIHERGEWLDCGNSVYRALATWCALVLHEYKGTLESDKNISTTIQEIIKPK